MCETWCRQWRSGAVSHSSSPACTETRSSFDGASCLGRRWWPLHWGVWGGWKWDTEHQNLLLSWASSDQNCVEILPTLTLLKRMEEQGRYQSNKREHRGLVRRSQEFSVSQKAWTKLDFHPCGKSHSVQVYKWLLMSGSGRAFSLSSHLRLKLCSASVSVRSTCYSIGNSVSPLQNVKLIFLLPTCPKKAVHCIPKKKKKNHKLLIWQIYEEQQKGENVLCFLWR